MSSPNLAGTWYTHANAPFPSTVTTSSISHSAMFMLKELLKGTSSSGTLSVPVRPSSTYWTVEGSSDGVTGSMDGVDRLTGSVPNSFDDSKWVHAVSGSAHSWIVLKSPNSLGPVWMCIDANSATATTFGVVFSRQQFTGSIPPSALPTQLTSSRPITNNAWAAGTSAEPVGTTNAIMVSDVSVGSMYRAHLSVDSSGAFNFLMSRDGTGIFSTFLALFNTIDRNPNDVQYPTFCMFNTVNTGRGAPAWGTVGTTAAACSGRTADGVVTHSVGGFSSWAFGATQFTATATPDLGSIYNRVLPVYIQTLVTNRMAWRGRVPDIWVTGNPVPGDSYPGKLAPTQHVAGDVLFPFAVVPIL